MLGSRGCGQAEQLCDLADAQLAALESQQHADAVLVTQRPGHSHELTHLHTAYFDIQRNRLYCLTLLSSGWRACLRFGLRFSTRSGKHSAPGQPGTTSEQIGK